MKTKGFLYVIAMLVLVTAGCQTTITPIEMNVNSAPIPWQHMSQEDIALMLSGAIKVTDPEKLLELDYLKEKWLISAKAYEVMIRMDQDSSQYFHCPEPLCSAKFDRKSLQNEMKKYFTR